MYGLWEGNCEWESGFSHIDIGWHEEKNNPTPFIRYMFTVILACYTRFEERVGIMVGNGGSTSSAYDIVKNIQKKKLRKYLMFP